MARRSPALLAFLLVASLLAPSVQAEASGGVSQFQVEWQLKQAVFPYEGHLEEGDAKAFRFLVEQTNVTRLQFLLTWEETHDRMRFSDPDEFTMEVRKPNGSPINGSPVTSRQGSLLLDVTDVNPVPEPVEMTAASEEAVRDRLDPFVTRGGMGGWSSTVWLDDVGNAQGVESDMGNDYELRVVLTYYEASVMRVVSLEDGVGGSGGFWAAAADEDPVWVWSTGGLAVMALGIGTFLVVDFARRRRRREP